MAQVIVGTTDTYTRAACNASAYPSGNYPNIVMVINYNFQIGFTGYGGEWIYNNYKFTFHTNTHYVNLYVKGGGGYWSPVMGGGSISLGWGNGESVNHVPGFSGSGIFNFNGTIRVSASISRPSSYQISTASDAISNITPFSVTLKALLNPNNNAYYRGKIYDAISGKTFGDFFSGNTTINVSGLTPQTTYNMSVKVYNRSGEVILNGGALQYGTFTTLSDQQKTWVKVNGAWELGKLWIKVDGVWRKVKELRYKENGVWRKIKNPT